MRPCQPFFPRERRRRRRRRRRSDSDSDSDIEPEAGFSLKLVLQGEKPKFYNIIWDGNKRGQLEFGLVNQSGFKKPKSFDTIKAAKKYFEKYSKDKANLGYVELKTA